jgi:hypothetical protein
MSNTDIINGIVAACTAELFKSHGIELARVDAAAGEMEYAALIGFASKQARGVVGLGMGAETLARISALAEAGRSPAVEDWIAENVNQLLGRIKNDLMRYGVVVSIALPTVLRGVRLQLMPQSISGVTTHLFESSFGSIGTWIDVRWTQDVPLALTSDPEMQGTDEGELILF